MKLSLKYPITPYIVFQNFGEDNACYRASDKAVVSKEDGTCPAGFVSLYGASGMKGHNGTDMFGATGTPIYSATDGFVEEVENDPNRGLGLGIITNDKFEFESGEYQAKVRYWHLQKFNVVKGQSVKQGDLIAWADNTGYSSGSHLHLELKPVAKNSKGIFYNVLQDNGYYGAINPAPYFDGTYAEKAPEFVITMKFGDYGDHITKLQAKLKELGYFPTTQPLTKYYGNITRKAVAGFQNASGISLTESVWGFWCGKKTLAKLNDLPIL